MGICLDAYVLAHKYWVNLESPRQLVPEEAFMNSNLEILIEFNLAKKTDKGVYVRGIESKGNARLKIFQDASDAGKRSAASRKAKYGSAIPINASNNMSNENRTTVERPPNETELSKVKLSKEENIYIAQQVELIYQKYPNKKGKQKGIEKITKQLLSNPDLLASFEKSVDGYAAMCYNNHTEQKYIKHFSTFCNKDWLDYIPVEKPKTEENLYVSRVEYIRS
jgi:hypothetical protein